MINQKYFNDIKSFPKQFAIGFKIAKDTKIDSGFEQIVLCGMGGSSYYVGLINDFLRSKREKIEVKTNRGYHLPAEKSSESLFLIVSFSGNTEEIVENYLEVQKRGDACIVLTSGGELEKLAMQDSVPLVKIPTGTQPRLSTGYFIGAVLQILHENHLIKDYSIEVNTSASSLDGKINMEEAKHLAESLKDRLPIFYATENIKSSAEIAKTKLNENSKVQAFWNYFPEINHNEMVSFTKLVTDPHFLIFRSKFAHERNAKRVEVFKKLMQEKGIPMKIIQPKGDSVLEEMLYNYYFIDFVSYYLAELLEIDPEPVIMVEEFKKLL